MIEIKQQKPLAQCLKILALRIFKLHYHNYPIKGLSNVRNEIMEKALLLDPDFVVFVDDDEYVTQALA